MLGQTLEILTRTKAILDETSNWFETVAKWYKNATLARNAIVEMLRSGQPSDRVLVSINGQTLEGASGVTDAHGRRVTWLLPSNQLQPGRNDIAVRVEKSAPSPLVVKAASIEQDYHLPWQTLVLSEAGEMPAPNLALTGQKNASTAADSLSVHPGGGLQFRLTVEHSAAANFTLHLGAGRAIAWLALTRQLINELRKAIRERVKEKLWQLKEQLERALQQNQPQVKALQDDLRTLEAYLRLHLVQVEPALLGPDSGTLQDIIDQTGSPDAIIRDLINDVPLEFARPAPPRTLPPVQGPPPLPRPVGRSTSSVGSCLAVVLLAVLVVAGTGAAIAWQNEGVRKWVQNTFAGNGGGKMGAAAAPAIADLLKAKGGAKGEVQITLYWTNKNDLDLHVVSPSGEEIFFGNRNSKCGGKLDVDMNVGYDAKAKAAVENVFWLDGKAPKGTYKVYVDHFRNHAQADCQDPTAFTIRVVNRGKTDFFTGEVVHADANRKKVLVHEFSVN